MLTCYPAGPALVSVDSALARRLVTAEQIAARVRGPHRVRALVALRHADGASQSPTETLARLALVHAGLKVAAGVKVPGVGWVDLLVEGRIVVELDGFAYHSGRAEYREDRRRDRELVRQGYLVLRFTFEDVMRDPGIVVRAVLAVLADRSGRPPYDDLMPQSRTPFLPDYAYLLRERRPRTSGTPTRRWPATW